MKEAESQIHSFPEIRKQHVRSEQRIPERTIWNGMLGRCYNPNIKEFRFYGAVGVRVCDRWHDPMNFHFDMGARPSPSHSLDRWPNKSGNYYKENCRWATKIEQANNCKNNIVITYLNRTQTLPEWCRELGLDIKNTRQRIQIYKWSAEKAFSTIGLNQFKRGQAHQFAKLSDDDVAAIRLQYNPCPSVYKYLAKKYSVCERTIYDIMLGKSRNDRQQYNLRNHHTELANPMFLGALRRK